MAQQRNITVKTARGVESFTGGAQLQTANVGDDFYFVSMPDPSSPSGRKVVWQQRIENSWREGVEITIEESDGPAV